MVSGQLASMQRALCRQQAVVKVFPMRESELLRTQSAQIDVRELSSDETALAYDPMAELRPDVGPIERFVAVINDVQRPEGYRLVASFRSDADRPSAVLGFRVGHSLAWGRHLYIDDLVTVVDERRKGHASALLNWAEAEVYRQHCDQLHLDSGTARQEAHRLYFARGLRITAFHFAVVAHPTDGAWAGGDG